MPEQFDSYYFAGQGPLFIAQRDANGLPAGLMFVGDLGEANLTPNVDTSEVRENVTGQRLIGSSIRNSLEYSLSINMRSVKPEHLAQALQGSNTAKAAGSVTDETHKGYSDKFTPLKYSKVSSVVVTDSTGVTTYVADTDYVLHADEGLIEVLSAGSITDGEDLLIDYDYADQHHIAADPGNLEYYLVFAGLNRANNDKQTRCEMYRVKLDPGVLGLIQEQQAEMTITGRLLTDMTRAAGDRLFSWKLED